MKFNLESVRVRPSWRRLCFLLGVSLFIFVAMTTFWGESERWTVAVAGHLSQGGSLYGLSDQPLLFLFLSIIFQISQWLSVHPMDGARFAFALNGLLILILTYKIVGNLTTGRKWSWIAVLAVLFSAIFLQQGYRVSSNLLLTSFHLFWFWTYFHKELSLEKKALLLFGALTFSFFTDPVALVLAAPLLIWNFRLLFENENMKSFFKWSLLGAMAGVVIWSLSGFDIAVENAYFSELRIHYLQDFLRKNWLVFWSFLFSLGGYAFYRSRTSMDGLKKGEKVSVIYSVWLLVVLLFVPNPHPSLIVAMLPFWVVSTMVIMSHIVLPTWKKQLQTRQGKGVLLLLVVAYLGQYAVESYHLLASYGNRGQREVSRALNIFLTEHPKLTVFDPSGIVPLRAAHRGNIKETLLASKPDVVLVTDSARAHWSWLFRFLTSYRYKDHGGGVWIRPRRLEVEERVGRVMVPEILKSVESYCTCPMTDDLFVSIEAYSGPNNLPIYLRLMPDSLAQRLELEDKISVKQMYNYAEIRFDQKVTYLYLHIYDAPRFPEGWLAQHFYGEH